MGMCKEYDYSERGYSGTRIVETQVSIVASGNYLN